MKFVVKIIAFVGLFSSIVCGQATAREQKLRKINELNVRISVLEQDVLSPEPQDTSAASEENLNVFRIMPREKFEGKLAIRGGGSYYSFTSKSHDYQKIAQISLEQNNLKVGFAGADYGFIADLGETLLADITKDSAQASFLVNYKSPTAEREARIEAVKTGNYEIDGVSYKNRVPVAVGHSYILRAISFDRANILVAFKIHRQDADGSLVIFSKLLENFEKPLLARNK